MILVTLEWTPLFEVGQKNGLDRLSKKIVLPTCPIVGQVIHVSGWYLEEGSKPEQVADYFQFEVKEIGYYLEGPTDLVELRVYLKLIGRLSEDLEYQNSTCEVLHQIYEWEKKL